MDRIELVGMRGNDAPFDRLFEPGPLKHRRLEDRGRGIRVVLQQFCRSASVEAEVEPAIEAAPRRGTSCREISGQKASGIFRRRRYSSSSTARPTSSRHMASISAVGSFDLAFDLVEREGVAGAFVPITLAVDGVKIKSGFVGGLAPVVALGAGEAPHGRPLAAAMGVAAMARGNARAADAARRRSRHRSRGNIAQPPVRIAHQL